MKRPARHIASVLLVTALAACSAPNPYYDASKPHHTREGFRNNYPHDPKGSFWAWQWERLRRGLPKKPPEGYRFDFVKQSILQLPNPSVTWIGHATVLLRVGGLNILTDPQFSERASPVPFAGPKRVVPPAIPLRELPHIDAVLISHSHYDHLDAPSVTALAKQPGGPPLFFVGLGLKTWFAQLGIENVAEMDWWEQRTLSGVTIHFAPVQHWSARTPFDASRTLWGAYVVEHPELRFFFAGDTGYSKDFADIGERFGPIDLAALPIGAYEPRWFMRIFHVNPEEAVQIHSDLKARHSMAIHWGTFERLTDESLYEPPMRLAQALKARNLADDAFWVLRHGETRSIERRSSNNVAVER
ncbi:MAG: MBL fold metallo-hydrolase [Burkholderiales bacterium]